MVRLTKILYEKPFRTASSVKWAEVRKFNRGKPIPPELTEKMNALLKEGKHKPMVFKLGTKDEKLWAQVLKGSKVLYEELLNRKYKDMDLLEEDAQEEAQAKGLQNAIAEVEKHKVLTDRAMARFKALKQKFDANKSKMERTGAAMVAKGVSREKRATIRKRFGIYEEFIRSCPDKAAAIKKHHAGEITSFRGGGAGRIARQHGLQKDNAEVGALFMEHTKAYRDFEGKVKAFEVKCKEAIATLEAFVARADGGQSETEAAFTLLDRTHSDLEGYVQTAQRNALKFTELEKFLKATVQTHNLVQLDAMIKTATNRGAALDKIAKRLEKLFITRVTGLPGDALTDPQGKRKVKDTRTLLDGFLKEKERFQTLTKKAIQHVQGVIQETQALDRQV